MSNQTQSATLSAYLFLGLSQCMVAINIVATKHLLLNLHPLMILCIRFCLATVLLSVFHGLSRQPTTRALQTLQKKDWVHLIIQAACAGVLFNGFLYIGLSYTSASVAGILASALPAFVVVFSVLFLGVRLTWVMSACVGLAILGLMIMNAHSIHVGHAFQWFGDLMVLLALVPEAFYYILTKCFPIKLPLFLLCALMNAVNASICVLILLWHHHHVLSLITSYQMMLLLLIGCCSALFYVFWFLGHEKVHGVAVGLSTAIVPLMTLLLAWVFLHETISKIQLLGMLVVLLSIIAYACYRPKLRYT